MYSRGQRHKTHVHLVLAAEHGGVRPWPPRPRQGRRLERAGGEGRAPRLPSEVSDPRFFFTGWRPPLCKALVRSGSPGLDWGVAGGEPDALGDTELPLHRPRGRRGPGGLRPVGSTASSFPFGVVRGPRTQAWVARSGGAQCPTQTPAGRSMPEGRGPHPACTQPGPQGRGWDSGCRAGHSDFPGASALGPWPCLPGGRGRAGHSQMHRRPQVQCGHSSSLGRLPAALGEPAAP